MHKYVLLSLLALPRESVPDYFFPSSKNASRPLFLTKSCNRYRCAGYLLIRPDLLKKLYLSSFQMYEKEEMLEWLSHPILVYPEAILVLGSRVRTMMPNNGTRGA